MPATISETGRPAIVYLQNGEFHARRPYPEGLGIYAFIAYVDALPKGTHISARVVAFAAGWSAINNAPIARITHEPIFSVREKSEILAAQRQEIATQLEQENAWVHPLKTTTLRIDHQQIPRYFLFTCVGDTLLDAKTKLRIAPAVNSLLHTNQNLMKRVTINPHEFDTEWSLGLKPGVISPFVTTHPSDLSGVVYDRDDNDAEYVAIAVSPRDTLIIERNVFSLTLLWWAENFLGVPLKAVRKN